MTVIEAIRRAVEVHKLPVIQIRDGSLGEREAKEIYQFLDRAGYRSEYSKDPEISVFVRRDNK